MGARSLLIDTHANSCYFRTSVDGEGRKALLQITERCNLHCAHCFVSSGDWGLTMNCDDVVERVLPRLVDARVERITLTGGEPFAHPKILEICAAIKSVGLPVGICTNGTQTSPEQVSELAALGNVHINVSFDGFRSESHGRFRGDRSSFATTVATTRAFGAAGLLQGLLSTPNALSEPEEFADLCEFAVETGAQYVLMNPLSAFGRGVKSKMALQAGVEKMRAVSAVTRRFADRLDLVEIRFPNGAGMPLGGCEAGKLIYVFADGLTAVCPYLVFAARTRQSVHRDTEFLVGNIIERPIAAALDDYDFHRRYRVGDNAKCGSCALASDCGKGCPAAVIADGRSIGEVDRDQCPIPDDAVQLPVVATVT